MLRREVVRLRLSFTSNEFRLLEILVHVMRDRSHVVEELGIDRPLLVFLPDRTADDLRTKLRDNIAQQKTLSIMNDRAESFVDCAIVIGSFSCRTEPSLIDSTSVKSECIQIIWMKFQSLARLQE